MNLTKFMVGAELLIPFALYTSMYAQIVKLASLKMNGGILFQESSRWKQTTVKVAAYTYSSSCYNLMMNKYMIMCTSTQDIHDIAVFLILLMYMPKYARV